MKPSWDDAPEWAEWLAMDHAGWAWFEFRPDYISGSWGAEGRIEALDEMPTKGLARYCALLERRS